MGEEATQAMPSQMPAREVEEPVTKEHLDRVAAELRAEIADRISEVGDKLFARMLTVAGLQLAAVTILLKAFT